MNAIIRHQNEQITGKKEVEKTLALMLDLSSKLDNIILYIDAVSFPFH